MDELELRVAALEAAFVAIGPWLSPDVLDDAAADLRAGLRVRPCADERVIRAGALALIEDARGRFRGVGAA